MRCFAMVLVALLTAWGPAVGHEVDPAVMAMFREWSLAPPSPSGVFICHGFGCDFRTEIGLAGSDRAQMSAIMASGSASAEAERVAIGRTEAWFERRIAPITGTAKRVARAGPLIFGPGNRAQQFDCIDTTNNTNSLLLILDQLKLLRHHTIAAPAFRFLFTEGPHNTAVIKDLARPTNSGRSIPGPTRAVKFPISGRSQSGRRADETKNIRVRNRAASRACLQVALNGPANLAQSCPLSVADRKSFEPSEHFRRTLGRQVRR